MKASDDLRKEHEAIQVALDILEQLLLRLDSQPIGFETQDANGIVEFLKIFADTCHHGKEEGILFPAYAQHGVPNEGGPIGVMLQEHVEGRQYIRLMSEAINQTSPDTKAFSIAAKKYITLLRSHIQKENDILYPFGDSFLSEEEQRKLFERFEIHEEQVIGKGKHEELHKQLERWVREYLGSHDH